MSPSGAVEVLGWGGPPDALGVPGAVFALAAGLAGLTTAAALIVPPSARSFVSGAGTALTGSAGAVAGAAAVTGAGWSVRLPGLLPLASLDFELDALGGVFVALTGAVAVVAGIFAIGYARGSGRVPHAVLPLFVASLLLVPAAGGIATFLLCWELMALTSTVLVASEHRRRWEVASAVRWYAVMTHLGFAALLAGFAVLGARGGDAFADVRAAGITGTRADLVFVLVLTGFAAKAGIVPLHAWLPRAHPEAPSHVSALMSAVMVTTGVYGLLRVGFDLLDGPRWWWLLVLALGAVSALHGILQAVVSADLKRLLGNSTTENMGLVFLGIGAAGLLATAGNGVLAGVALTAALLHVVVHAAVKCLLFLAAGSVLHATGTRDLDALGGLRRRMPATTLAFGVGALAASALPPGPAFLSEWLLLQSLVHGAAGDGSSSTATAVAMPLAVAVVALTAGLSVATFVKAFGVGFLARPRTAEAAAAHETGPTMRAASALGMLACAALALAPGPLLSALGPVGAALGGPGSAPAVDAGPVLVELAGFRAAISPLMVTLALVVATVGVAGVVRLLARPEPDGRLTRAGERTEVRLWDCGAGPPTPRMQYTATSFAEPLQRVFDDVVRPEHGVDVTHVPESAYLVESVEYRLRVPDRVEHRVYAPALAAVRVWQRLAPVLANGSVHRYLGYGFTAVLAALVALVVLR